MSAPQCSLGLLRREAKKCRDLRIVSIAEKILLRCHRPDRALSGRRRREGADEIRTVEMPGSVLG